MKKVIVAGLLFVIAILICFACSPTKDEPLLEIIGHVKDSDTADPIEGVWFNLGDNPNDPLAYSDSEGSFVIGLLGSPPFTVTIYFGKEGYTTSNAEINFPKGQRIVTGVEFELTKSK